MAMSAETKPKNIKINYMKKWTYNEVLLALYAYCHVPFNKANNSNSWIVKIASVIGRSPAAVKMKIGNLGAFDPLLKAKGIVGLSNTSQIDEIVWKDYNGKWDKLVYDAEMILTAEGEGLISNLVDLPQGSEAYYTAKRRINQDFFRCAVLSSYNNKCCISGISVPSLLEAAHIISWSNDAQKRTDPTNGICLNPLFHKAYDCFLMTITPDFRIVLSDEFILSIKDETTSNYLIHLQNRPITMPNRFLPNRDNLAEHYELYISRN